ncbi:hypothetical protein ACFVXQ_31010 [Kitasatospora sp. NPDC058263]
MPLNGSGCAPPGARCAGVVAVRPGLGRCRRGGDHGGAGGHQGACLGRIGERLGGLARERVREVLGFLGDGPEQGITGVDARGDTGHWTPHSTECELASYVAAGLQTAAGQRDDGESAL